MHSVNLRQWSWGTDVFMHLSNHWISTALLKVLCFSSTTNLPVIHPLPKDISWHHNWRIWITGESQCPRSTLTSSLAGGIIKEEWSHMSNRWDRKFCNDNMPVKHILPGISLLLALDHVFSSKFLFQNQKNLSHLAFLLILPMQGIPHSLLIQFQL